MALELDAYERWLLEMVATLRYPVDVLGSEEIELHLNRPGHGRPFDEMVARVQRLAREGLVEVFGPDDVYFGLTAAGGAAWEAFAAPAWDRYVWDEADEHDLWITSPVRERVELLLRCLFGDDPGVRAEATWDSVAPWQATYWKELPRGIRCRVPGGYEREPRAPMSAWDPDVRRWFRRVELPR